MVAARCGPRLRCNGRHAGSRVVQATLADGERGEKHANGSFVTCRVDEPGRPHLWPAAPRVIPRRAIAAGDRQRRFRRRADPRCIARPPATGMSSTDHHTNFLAYQWGFATMSVAGDMTATAAPIRPIAHTGFGMSCSRAPITQPTSRSTGVPPDVPCPAITTDGRTDRDCIARDGPGTALVEHPLHQLHCPVKHQHGRDATGDYDGDATDLGPYRPSTGYTHPPVGANYTTYSPSNVIGSDIPVARLHGDGKTDRGLPASMVTGISSSPAQPHDTWYQRASARTGGRDYDTWKTDPRCSGVYRLPGTSSSRSRLHDLSGAAVGQHDIPRGTPTTKPDRGGATTVSIVGTTGNWSPLPILPLQHPAHRDVAQQRWPHRIVLDDLA